jgi:hypothetical protein
VILWLACGLSHYTIHHNSQHSVSHLICLCHRQLVTDYSSWRRRFSPRVVPVKSVVDSVALLLSFFPCQLSFNQCRILIYQQQPVQFKREGIHYNWITLLQECATLRTLYQWVPHAVSVSTHICLIMPCQWLFCIGPTPATCKYPRCLRPFLTSSLMGLSSTGPGRSLRSSSLAPGYVVNLSGWHTFRTFFTCCKWDWAGYSCWCLCEPVHLMYLINW